MSRPLIALDTNLLIYAHNADSPWHAAARRSIENLANASAAWAIPWPCMHEFLAVATNPKLVAGPEAVEGAVRQVELWMESPTLWLLGELAGHWAELRTILKSREPLYARASAMVDTAGLTVDAAATRLIDAVAPVLHNDAHAFGLRSAAR